MHHEYPDRGVLSEVQAPGLDPLPRTPRARDALLRSYAIAVLLTTVVAWLVYRAAAMSAANDLTGHVESLLPLARLGMLSSPLVVAFRGGVAAVTMWLVAGAMNDRLPLRTVATIVFTTIPLLEVPVLVDAVSVMLSPTTSWADAHIPLGFDALLPNVSGPPLLLAQGLNLAVLAWVAFVAGLLRPRLSRGATAAVPAAATAAVVLALLPLMRG